MIASIIVVTYNSALHIAACLDALTQLTTELPHEIIVVDNVSQDETLEIIRDRYPAVTLVEQQENLGFAGGVNRGVERASGKYIALLNPDAVPQPDWLDHIVAPLSDDQIGVGGGKVLSEDGRIQSVGAILDSRLMLPAYRGEGEADAGQYDQPADVWSVHGAAMAFARGPWEQFAGLDEGFFPAYLEESDFCERARRAGLRVITAPRAVVRHHESASTGKYSAEFYYYFLRNRLRYAAKWLDWEALWNEFRLAEANRLQNAPLLDRRVARLVYQDGVPPLVTPDASQRASILAKGQALRTGALPNDGLDVVVRLLQEAQANSVHEEVRFQSRLPLVAAARTAWNNVATRWYVRPNLDQQTRFNLALHRVIVPVLEKLTEQAAIQALDVSLLALRLRSTTDSSTRKWPPSSNTVS